MVHSALFKVNSLLSLFLRLYYQFFACFCRDAPLLCKNLLEMQAIPPRFMRVLLG